MNIDLKMDENYFEIAKKRVAEKEKELNTKTLFNQ